ncbi:nucleotide sugar dehydrogenase [Gammaproteobacteria bacterium]|nr:nucleotide sugar dehydrogenase [Gammaproteobacteria bacterium]
MSEQKKIAIIGLGYVGLPLAVAFGKQYKTLGFDIDDKRVSELLNGFDRTNELTEDDLKGPNQLDFTTNEELLDQYNVYIITVPTPIDNYNQPDLRLLEKACKQIGKFLKKNDIVIIESTVYPMATEEICVPVLEKTSGLRYISEANSEDEGFYCAYSPERINPGDKNKPLTSIKKIVSGSTKQTLNSVDDLYRSIIKAGTIRANSIKAAEAAKVIENTQRDVNIALINEFALIFNKLGIDTQEVLELAETKWNFISLRPGLVGGHCIGVDPYYLAHKAIESDYFPELIIAGRKLNNLIPKHIAQQVMKLMSLENIQLQNSNVLLMGFTFKENCSDIRNTKVFDIIQELNKYNCNVDIYDPLIDFNSVKKEYDNLNIIKYPKNSAYDAVIIAVAHDEFKQLGFDEVSSFGREKSIIYDVKYLFKRELVDGRL